MAIRHRRRAAALLFLSLLPGCGGDALPPDVAPSDDEAVQIAVFRELMTTEGWQGAAAYCLSIGAFDERRDPSAAVLRAFRGSQPPIVPGSACTVSVQGTFHDGKRGQTFGIGSLVVERSSARVEAMYHLGGRNAGSFLCQLAREPDGWRVRSCSALAIA
jgi:hypothetical protein